MAGISSPLILFDCVTVPCRPCLQVSRASGPRANAEYDAAQDMFRASLSRDALRRAVGTVRPRAAERNVVQTRAVATRTEIRSTYFAINWLRALRKVSARWRPIWRDHQQCPGMASAARNRWQTIPNGGGPDRSRIDYPDYFRRYYSCSCTRMRFRKRTRPSQGGETWARRKRLSRSVSLHSATTRSRIHAHFSEIR